MLYDILLAEDVVPAIKNNTDYLLDIIPELKYMMGFDHKHPHHHLDVWNHTLYALSLSKRDFDVRLALLLHDIGKPFSYQEGDVRHFKNHPDVSMKMTEEILRRLGFNRNYIKKICYLVKNHDNPITDDQINDDYDLVLKLYDVQYCDALAHHPDKLEKRKKYLDSIKKKIKR